jgi:hypothetical protein
MKNKKILITHIVVILAVIFIAATDIKFNNNKSMITDDGGTAYPFINNTGGASEKGRIVEISGENSVEYTGVDSVDPIGIMYSDGVANGSIVWVVMHGKAKVLLDDNTGSTAGNWVETSEAGYADATQADPPGPVLAHFQEIGHCIETVAAGGAGTHVLTTIIVHFL